MNAPICPSSIGSLVRIWTAIHRDLSVEIDAPQTRQLHEVLLGLEDDLVARLLGVKLSLARPPAADHRQLASCGRTVIYSVHGRTCRARIVHGSMVDAGELGVGSSFGVALLGLRAGQELLWPGALGKLAHVRLLEVEPARSAAWRSADAFGRRGTAPCASG